MTAADKLLIVSPGAFQPYGHQQSYLAGLGEALARAGTEVHVLGWAGPLGYPAAIRCHPVARGGRPRTRAGHRRRLGPLGDVAWGAGRVVGELGLLRAIARTHRALGEPALLFESCEYVSLLALLATNALGDAPRACIFHDTNFNAQHASPVARAYKTAVRPCVAAILRRIDVAFVHAPGMKENLLANVDRRGAHADKVQVLPYGAPHPDEVARIARDEARARLGLPRDRPLALAFGTLRADKCLDVVVDGVARCPGWDLVVAGPEGDFAWERLRSMARASGLGDRLHAFEEFVPTERHALFFGACDAVVSLYAASVRHESGTAQLARAFLAPVIVGGPPDLCDYVRASGSGWVLEPVTGDALATTLGDVARLPADAATDLGAAIRRAAEERSWGAVASRLRAALEAGTGRDGRRNVARVRRALEAAIVLGALALAAPLLLAIAVAVLVTMGRPVLFRHRRAGLHGRPFMLLKFRTMRPGPPDEPDGARITRLGSFLRAWSLDELPQLWNVVRGDMALVGPRPLLVEYLARYTQEQARRHEVLPGLTGLAQVSGRNALTWDEKFALDVWYVDHRSLRLDASILWRTLLAVLRRDGVSAPGHATMPFFVGSGR